MKQAFFMLGAAVLISSCGGPGSKPASTLPEIDSASIDRHLTVLSADSFEGRKPFSPGEALTVEYLSQQFREMGLEPGNGDSYFQEVPLVMIDGSSSETMKVAGQGKNFDLKLGENFVAYTERVVDKVEISGSELVFCGFGIVAPEYNWNDYEGLDMKGKTAVVLVNDPGFQSGDSSLFKGDIMTYYGRWTYKYEEAARQGAEGVLIVHSTVPAGYPWLVVQNSWSGGKLGLEMADGNMSKCAMQGWITRDAAIQLFKASGQQIDDYVAMARSRDFKPFSLNLNISLTIDNKIEKNTSKNVVAKISGATAPDEYVLYSAHWDHLGIGLRDEKGDSIYNGANDNASGTAGLLAIAEAFAKLKEKPARSVVFLAVTAEEQGLLGSEYYARNPIYPPSKTVANINMDGLNGYGPMKDLTVIGFGQSELDDYAEKLAQEQGRYVKPDPDPGKGYFFRSDHFNFAKVGIPAIFASGDYEHMTKGVDYIEEQKKDYLANRYHRPGDHYSENYRLGGVVQDASLFFKLGYQLANGQDWPKWKEGSEFKAVRESKK